MILSCLTDFFLTGFNSAWVISILFTVLTYYIIYSLKPKLEIESICILDKAIKVKVVNKGRFDAVNLRIEICAFNSVNNITSHFAVDHTNFLILPSGKKGQGNTKYFKTNRTSRIYLTRNNKKDKYFSLLEKVQSGKLNVRVRLHAYHSFSGLGRAFEKIN